MYRRHVLEGEEPGQIRLAFLNTHNCQRDADAQADEAHQLPKRKLNHVRGSRPSVWFQNVLDPPKFACDVFDVGEAKDTSIMISRLIQAY